jgi:diguanylate cyclase (GGDEF)-like protein
MDPRDGGAVRRHWTVVLAAVSLVVVLGTLAVVISSSQQQSHERLEASFKLRGTTTATLIATFLSQQAQREKHTAERFLSAAHISEGSVELVASAFGSHAAVVLDGDGAVLGVVPADRALLGHRIASRYAHLQLAESGETAVSNVVPSAATGEAVTAIAVPFQTILFGRRVFSAAYAVKGDELSPFVSHTSTTPGHRVLLVDGVGNVLAASPRAAGATLAAADPPLARVLSTGRQSGGVPGARVASQFVAASVPGTAWRLLIEVPNRDLFASVGGSAQVVPWLIFALVTLLAVVLLGLFVRSLRDRTRLARLSGELESIARTDPLTRLLNRRGFDEHAAPAFALARRREEPISVLMIDLDRFKEVNDNFGHEAGDRVLCALADCMRSVLRTEDVLARLGGDEFVVLMTCAGERAARSAAERLADCAGEVDLSALGLERGIPMSIGTATGTHVTIDALIRQADAELYRIKSAGRTRESTLER